MLGNRVLFQSSWLARVLVLALVAVNLLLLKQNFDMRRQLVDHGKTANRPVDSLKQGDVVRSIVGFDFNGQTSELKYQKSGRQHFVMYFSPNCIYCVQQAPQWREVLNNIDTSRFDVLGVVSDKEDKKAVFEHADGFGYFKAKTPLPVLFASNDVLASYKLMATPTTLLIGSDGNVEHVWVGKWDEIKASEVVAALK
jgi:peroxiredoxin